MSTDTPNRNVPATPVIVPPATLAPQPAVHSNARVAPGLGVSLRTQLDAYLKVMDPTKQLTDVMAAQQQTNMWKILNMIFGQPPEAFPELWGILLEVISKHSTGAFSPMYAFRGVPQAKGVGIENKRNFVRLMRLALTTADPTTRAMKVRKLDFKHILRGFPNAGVGNRIADFYRV
jgi:hypothetical protein